MNNQEMFNITLNCPKIKLEKMEIKTMKHCWKDKIDYFEEQGLEYGSLAWCEIFQNSATCLLEDGHTGKHNFTPDDELIIEFA